MPAEDEFERLVETTRKAGAVLRDADVPYALGGGLASWVRGGPKTEHDIDFFVKPEDAERALAALADAGFRPEPPVEAWLPKAYDGGLLLDLIFNPASGRLDPDRPRRERLRPPTRQRTGSVPYRYGCPPERHLGSARRRTTQVGCLRCKAWQ